MPRDIVYVCRLIFDILLLRFKLSKLDHCNKDLYSELDEKKRNYNILEYKFSFLENQLKETSDSKTKEVNLREERERRLLDLMGSNAALKVEIDIKSK